METRKPGISRLIVQKIDEERKTAGGLFMAESFESPTQTAKILAVGECKGKYDVGDRCMITRHAGIEIGLDELVILEGDVLLSWHE